MNRLTRAYLAVVGLSVIGACGGQSLNLDQNSETPSGGGGAGALGVVEKNQLKDRINDFWVDDSRIYWSTNGAFQAQSCVYGRCAATLVTYGQSWGPISPSGEDIFFPALPMKPSGGFGGTLIRCPKQGCTGTPEPFLQDSAIGLAQLASDDLHLYWPSSFDIYRCPLEKCGDIPEFVAKSKGSDGPLNLLGQTVFWWGISDTATVESRETRIYSAPKDGSRPPSTLTPSGPSGETLIYDEPVLAVGSEGIYWLDRDSHVQHCPLIGCGDAPPVTLVSTDIHKTSVWVDAANLYWLEVDGLSTYGNLQTGTIRFCPISGCADGVESKALTSNRIRKFVLTTDYVYWNEPETTIDNPAGVDKVIYRMAKPRFNP